MMHIPKKRLMFWAITIGALLLIPIIAMLFTNTMNWGLGDFIFLGAILFGIGMAYEVITRKSENMVYRVAFGVGLAGAFLLLWVNGAVGIIGSENNPANLMYGAVFAVGIMGALIAQFKPSGMSLTLFAMAVVQLLVPVVALTIWPANASWGGAGVFGVFILNAIFALFFVVSALLFRRARVS